MLGTNVTRIVFVIPFQMFPKARALLALLHIPHHGSDTFMLGTNVTRIRIFPKQGALLHIPFKSGFMVQTPFMLGTNVTRIVFVIPFQMFPKARGPY
jgi:hypothetical protein